MGKPLAENGSKEWADEDMGFQNATPNAFRK